MQYTYSRVIKSLVVVFAILSGLATAYLGPIDGYHHIDPVHAWLHITLAIVGLICALSLLASRIYLVALALLFLVMGTGDLMMGGHMMHMTFAPHPYVAFVHLSLTALFFYFAVIYQSGKKLGG